MVCKRLFQEEEIVDIESNLGREVKEMESFLVLKYASPSPVEGFRVNQFISHFPSIL
jgi:hypothetical protein